MNKQDLLPSNVVKNVIKKFDCLLGMILIIILLLGIASCRDNTLYDEILPIPGEGWINTMPAYFNIEVDDTLTYQAISLTISHTVAYSYSNIYFFITIMLPDGRMARDTINCELANIYGEWYGKGLGNIKTLHIPYRQNFLFPFKGNYKFYFEQAMRDDTLKHITALGLNIKQESY